MSLNLRKSFLLAATAVTLYGAGAGAVQSVEIADNNLHANLCASKTAENIKCSPKGAEALSAVKRLDKDLFNSMLLMAFGGAGVLVSLPRKKQQQQLILAL